jgi:hypothetical protein
MKIPTLDLVSQYQKIKPEIDQAIVEVLVSGEYILGSKVQENFLPDEKIIRRIRNDKNRACRLRSHIQEPL